MHRNRLLGAVLVALLSPLAFVPASAAGPPAASVKVLPASNHVTGHYPAACKAVGQLPDPSCTPGSASDAVTQSNLKTTVCASGYTGTVRPPRSETGKLKVKAMKAYGVPTSGRATTQLDHLVPLELGGSSDTTNLWPEVDPKIYMRKDKVEDRLRAAVCSSRVRLVPAQDAVAQDWTTALRRLGL